jgi:hypothetical protein
MIKKILLVLALSLLPSICNSQVVGRNICKVSLETYDPKEDDGDLSFEIDCRMVDCLLELEIIADERRKKKFFTYWIYESNYYLSEDSLIMMKLDLGNMKKLIDDNKYSLMNIRIYSKSTSLVFQRMMSFDRENLIRTYYRKKNE